MNNPHPSHSAPAAASSSDRDPDRDSSAGPSAITRATGSEPHPSNHESTVFVLNRALLEHELKAAYSRLDQSREDWIRDLMARLQAQGNVNPWGKSFIVILDRAGEDPTEVSSVALDRSVDWTVHHSIGLTTSRVAKFGIDLFLQQVAKEHLGPQISRRLAQLGWAEAQLWYDYIAEDAWLNGQRLGPENAKSIVQDLRDTVWAPLPEPVLRILDHLLEAAHPLAASVGLNGTQLFIEGRLSPLMRRHPAFKAFEALAPETQKTARQWLIDALRWNLFYPLRGLPARTANPTHNQAS